MTLKRAIVLFRAMGTTLQLALSWTLGQMTISGERHRGRGKRTAGERAEVRNSVLASGPRVPKMNKPRCTHCSVWAFVAARLL